ncbi:MAG: hypothetical protein K8S00_02145 [Bacteroidales bacterium]|nr:hypothetical protein [Bacteroidales bacterium]
MDNEGILYKYTETTPPKFGNIMPWEFDQVESNKFRIMRRDDIIFIFRIIDMIWYHVQIISRKNKYTTLILINGKE